MNFPYNNRDRVRSPNKAKHQRDVRKGGFAAIGRTQRLAMGLYTSYYAYGLPTFLIIVIALYLLFTGMCILLLRMRTGQK